MLLWFPMRSQLHGPGFAERVQTRGITLAGSSFNGLHVGMQEFVDHAPGKCFHGGKLLSGERTQAGVNALQFAEADFFRLSLHGNNGWSDVDGALALMEAVDFGFDEGFSVNGLAAALFHVGGCNLLQIVHVVDEDSFQIIHCRVHIARNGNVNKEHRAVSPFVEEGVAVLGAEDVMRRAGGGDDDVRISRHLIKLLEGDDTAVELLGHALGALLGAVADENGAGSLLDEVAGSQFTHFAGADEKDRAALESAKDFPGQFYGN